MSDATTEFTLPVLAITVGHYSGSDIVLSVLPIRTSTISSPFTVHCCHLAPATLGPTKPAALIHSTGQQPLQPQSLAQEKGRPSSSDAGAPVNILHCTGFMKGFLLGLPIVDGIVSHTVPTLALQFPWTLQSLINTKPRDIRYSSLSVGRLRTNTSANHSSCGDQVQQG